MALPELTRPLSVIDALFEQCTSKNGGEPVPEFGESSHFQKVLGLDNEEALARIPCLNDVEMADSVPPFSLVRYRCLVQDVFEPEFYAGLFEEVDAGGASRFVTSKYRECLEPAAGRELREIDGHGGLLQRGACYCVPLPGEASWSRAAAVEWTRNGGGAIRPPAPATNAGYASKAKRGREDDVAMDPQEEVSQRPRVADGAASASAVPVAPAADAVVCTPCTGSRGGILGGATGSSNLRSAEDFGLNFPLPAEERRGHGASTACIVKLYDDNSEILRLCESIEVIGILCVNPDLASFGSSSMEDDWRDARHPSTSLVPRLHALAVRQLPFYNPLLPFTTNFLSEERLAAVFQRHFSVPGALVSARTAALQKILRCVGGDELSAEYLLMLLVSRSFAKHGEKLLGMWSLNVAGATGLDTAAIKDVASDLVPRAVHFELTVDNLNNQKWRPRKDFVADRLVAAQLQLSAGTFVVVDETKMAEGNLTADGHKALLSLQKLVTDSKLACDFVNYDVNIPLELPCVCFSERKSVVKDVEVLVPMRANASAATAAGSVSLEAVTAARWLIALVTRSQKPLNIPDEVQKTFSEDFAAARQEFKVKPELAHTWMALARARCLSFGEDQLSLQRWREVITMERSRLLRCREDGMLDA